MLTITLQLVMLSGEGRGRGDTNLTTPTQHRQKWKKEPETYQMKEPDIEGLLQIPFWGRSNDIYFLHKTVPQKLHQGKKKNQQHCYQGCGINSKSSNSCFSISQWLILANETWVLPPVSLLSRGMETSCDSLVSLFPAPEAACSTWYTCEPVEPHWPQNVCSLVMNVCVCTCVFLLRLGSQLFQHQNRAYSEDLKGRQNLSHEAGTFLDLLFLLCLQPKLLPQVSTWFLLGAWLIPSHHDWLTNN